MYSQSDVYSQLRGELGRAHSRFACLEKDHSGRTQQQLNMVCVCVVCYVCIQARAHLDLAGGMGRMSRTVMVLTNPAHYFSVSITICYFCCCLHSWWWNRRETPAGIFCEDQDLSVPTRGCISGRTQKKEIQKNSKKKPGLHFF